MIKVQNLTKAYGKQQIFNNASFTLPDNGLVCLLGASGCGKSTLLNMLAGFDSDYSGSIHVFGTALNTLSGEELCHYRRDHIGFVFQNYNLLPGYTVTENILLACDPDIDNTCQLNGLLERFDMLAKADAKVENLSGGQKQRAAIIRALINEPTIILADEPTGALDRKNSTEIMALLKELSKERLVFVITHDKKICEFADEVVTIADGLLVGSQAAVPSSEQPELTWKKTFQTSAFRCGVKNFRVHLNRFIAVSLAISIGVLAFMLSLSSGNMMEKYISDFKEKHTAFNNGYVKAEGNTDEVFRLLQADSRIENVYKQYVIHDVSLAMGANAQEMTEKYPMPKATEDMSYGIMPKIGENQIALSPSLAKKFDDRIDNLIGKQVILTFNSRAYTLTVSGIFNASYDDFFVSSDMEQAYYSGLTNKKAYSVSYDVKRFEDIVAVTQALKDAGIESKTAEKEVAALQSTFQNLSRLFLIVSVLVLAIGLFISIILIVKLQNARYRELGLLSALGFSKKHITAMIISENVLLSVTAAVLNALLTGVVSIFSRVFMLGLIITAPQIILSIISTGVVVITIGIIASLKLIHTEPAAALRK